MHLRLLSNFDPVLRVIVGFFVSRYTESIAVLTITASL